MLAGAAAEVAVAATGDTAGGDADAGATTLVVLAAGDDAAGDGCGSCGSDGDGDGDGDWGADLTLGATVARWRCLRNRSSTGLDGDRFSAEPAGAETGAGDALLGDLCVERGGLGMALVAADAAAAAVPAAPVTGNANACDLVHMTKPREQLATGRTRDPSGTSSSPSFFVTRTADASAER